MKYTQAHKDYLRDNQNQSRADLTVAFNKHFDTDISYDCIHSACKRFKFKSGRDSQFKPGHKTWNKDTKGLTSANKTSFKKGNRPLNWKPIGHIRTSRDGYIEIKTKEPNVFELKHRVIWLEHNGPLPNNSIITFIDGDATNCNIENLEMISRQEHVRRNKMKLSSYPPELQPTIKLIAKVQAGATKLKESA